MTTPRTLAGLGITAALLFSLTACFQLPVPNNGGNGGDNGGGNGSQTEAPADTDIVGTSWSGTDSDGDTWGFEFQEDNTIGLTFQGNSYDDATDTWELSGGTLNIHAEFVDGPIDLTGAYTDADTPIDLAGTYPGGTFTLTITRD